MRAGHAAEFFRASDPDEARKILHVLLVGATGFLVPDVGKPLQLRRRLGQALEFGSSQGTGNRHGLFGQDGQRRLTVQSPARQVSDSGRVSDPGEAGSSELESGWVLLMKAPYSMGLFCTT